LWENAKRKGSYFISKKAAGKRLTALMLGGANSSVKTTLAYIQITGFVFCLLFFDVLRKTEKSNIPRA